jgi:hypothetical protein
MAQILQKKTTKYLLSHENQCSCKITIQTRLEMLCVRWTKITYCSIKYSRTDQFPYSYVLFVNKLERTQLTRGISCSNIRFRTAAGAISMCPPLTWQWTWRESCPLDRHSATISSLISCVYHPFSCCHINTQDVKLGQPIICILAIALHAYFYVYAYLASSV